MLQHAGAVGSLMRLALVLVAFSACTNPAESADAGVDSAVVVTCDGEPATALAACDSIVRTGRFELRAKLVEAEGPGCAEFISYDYDWDTFQQACLPGCTCYGSADTYAGACHGTNQFRCGANGGQPLDTCSWTYTAPNHACGTCTRVLVPGNTKCGYTASLDVRE